MNSFYSEEELAEIGFKSVGKNVKLSRKASIYGAHNISIGDNVRIDDFCILSGLIEIGSNIHISAYCALYGSMGIELKDFSGMSPRATIYSAMDDFSGDFLVGPVHPDTLTNVTGGKVVVEEYVQIGCNSVIFPALTVGKGAVIGAISLVNNDIEQWGIYAGVPVKRIKERRNGMIKLRYTK